jgi:hypothetical protein
MNIFGYPIRVLSVELGDLLLIDLLCSGLNRLPHDHLLLRLWIHLLWILLPWPLSHLGIMLLLLLLLLLELLHALHLLKLLHLVHLVHVLHSWTIVEIHVRWHASRPLHRSNLRRVVLGKLGIVHLVCLMLQDLLCVHHLLLTHWLAIHTTNSLCSLLLTKALLNDRLLLLLLKLLLLSRGHIHLLAGIHHHLRHVRDLSHWSLERADLAHPWGLAHLSIKWCRLKIWCRTRHAGRASMALLTSLCGHIMSRRASHLRMTLVNSGSWTWRATTHTRCGMLHLDISHAIVHNGRRMALWSAISNNWGRYLTLRHLLVESLRLALNSVRDDIVRWRMSMSMLTLSLGWGSW